MEKYIIYKQTSETDKVYLRTIYRTSNNNDDDIGEAIEFDNKELALLLASYINERDDEKYKVMLVKTTIEEVVE